MRPTWATDSRAEGFTLIELLVALGLFALISLAGIRLVEAIVGVQDRSVNRAERLGELQRGFYLINADFAQLTAGPFLDGGNLALTRVSNAGDYPVIYRMQGGALHRMARGQDRVILDGVAMANWRFLQDGVWSDQPATKERPHRPEGVELTVELEIRPGQVAGPVRRLMELPDER